MINRTKLLFKNAQMIVLLCMLIFAGHGMNFWQNGKLRRLEKEHVHALIDEHHEIILGQRVVKLLMEVKADLHAMTSRNNQQRVLQDLLAVQINISEINQLLDILENGGTLRISFPVNYEKTESQQVLVSLERKLHDHLSLPIMELRPHMETLSARAEELEALVSSALSLKSHNHRQAGTLIPDELEIFYKQVEPLFVRLEQNANKMYFDSHFHLREMKEDIDRKLLVKAQQQRLISWSVALVVIFLLVMVLRKLLQFQQQLANNVQALEASKRNLSDANNLFRNIFNGVDEIVYVANLKTSKVLFANRYAKEQFGLKEGDVCWKIACNDQDCVCERCEIYTDDKVSWDIGETRVWEQQSKQGDREVHAQIIEWNEGDKAALIISIDISERKRAERELEESNAHIQELQRNKLDSVGVLAGGIAHDFNNLLAAILGNLSLAELHTEQQSEIMDMIVDAKNASLRAKDLTGRLLTFATGGAPVCETISLPELLKESASFALSGSKVKCNFLQPHDLWPVRMDKSQIGQVVQNLVVNAVQAIPEGGQIQIACKNRSIAAGGIEELSAGDYVTVMVADDGPGIPPDLLGKIFEPYFSTKRKTQNQGSGLGLAIIKSVMNRHGGAVSVRSQPGQGAEFTLYLPAVPNESVPDTVPIQKLVSGEGCILIMDDEEMVLNVLKRMLQHLGYGVVTAYDCHQAFDLFMASQREGKPFDLVITDLTVPGGAGGQCLVRRLHGVAPQTRVVVASGYSEDPVLNNYGAYGFCDRIVKPYQIEEISHVLTRVLGEKTGKPVAVIKAEPESQAEDVRILVVDDESILAQLYQSMLESQNFQVTSCTKATDALARFRETPLRFDVLFTDYLMPEMTGVELAAEIRIIRPDIPVILCCGDKNMISEEEKVASGISVVCEKPLDLEQLVEFVRTASAAGKI